METKQIVGMVVAALLFIAIGASNVLTGSVASVQNAKAEMEMAELFNAGGMSITPPSVDYIGVVPVIGTIQQEATETSLFEIDVQTYKHDSMMEYIDIMISDTYNKGLMLYIDSPGGTVYESEELYNKIVEYQEVTGRQVWSYMSHYAASGGYMVTASADKIFANPNTTTGSIGVIISGLNMTGLYEKLGIEQISITSGKNKDSSQMTDEQIAIYQSIVDESYQRFVEIVATGRNMSVEDVKVLADGRIYSGMQAKENGLVDEISSHEDMLAAFANEIGVTEFYQPTTTMSMFGNVLGGIEDIVPKSEAEILVNLTEELGSGVPMYYAEPLQ